MAKRLPSHFGVDDFEEVWAASRDRVPGTAGKPGVDGVTAAQFASERKSRFIQIQEEIRAGSYSFSRLRIAPVPKATGGERIIAVPTVRDRLVQRAILNYLEKDKKFNAASPIAYGFTKARTLQDAQTAAVALREQRPWVLKADIVKFFDNVDRPLLLKKIERVVRSKTIKGLLRKVVNCELDDSNPKGRLIAIENGIKKGRGLRQGMPLSPVLSNLLLKDFDREISKAGLKAIRYADDLVVFCHSEKECRDALDYIRAKLKQLRLRIPDLEESGKTSIKGPTEKVEFLGVDIKYFSDGYRLCAPIWKVEKIEKRLDEMCTVEFCADNQITLTQALRSLDSMLIGHDRSMAIVSDREAFSARLKGLQKRYVKKLMISLLGQNAFESLSEVKKAILGLQEFPKNL